jgi:hypothetical protein
LAIFAAIRCASFFGKHCCRAAIGPMTKLFVCYNAATAFTEHFCPKCMGCCTRQTNNPGARRRLYRVSPPGVSVATSNMPRDTGLNL